MTFQGDYTVVLGFVTCAGLGFPQRSVTQEKMITNLTCNSDLSKMQSSLHTQ
jgi:hypothetical protein